MCGIAGIYARGEQPIASERLIAMRDDQRHRGPDASGLRVEPHAGLAFNRLAIIDLSPAANQPMVSDDGRHSIVFNGEIYNFLELRSELESRGRPFRTKSDTETILRGYEAWGEEVFARLNGMFAIALWDAARERLLLARDRVGKKPLFYAEGGGEVVFASEARALLKGLQSRPDIDPEAIDLYLTYHCVPGPRSIFQGVRKVPPGTVIVFDRSGSAERRFWRISYRSQQPISEPEALERLDALLDDATRIRMISDVPIGAFLSGGVDSSTVVALMSRHAQPVRTFTVGFADQTYDESPFARTVASALGTRHEELVVEPDAAAILPALVWHYGEPFADSSAVPTYYVSAAARREVTVVLNGDGGDEGFAGYQWHRTIQAAARYRALVPAPLRRLFAAPARSTAARAGLPESLRSLGRLAGDWGGRSAEAAFWIWQGVRSAERASLYDPAFLKRLAGIDPEARAREAWRSSDGASDLDRSLQVGIETYLPDDLLVKVDIASMAHSLEARSPLLDYRVLEFAASLPDSLKVRGLQTKHLLKTYAARLVPESVVYRPKQGFSMPVAEWLRGPLRRPLQALVTDARFAARGVLRPEPVLQALDRHSSGEDLSAQLWSILWLELWFRMFVDGDLRRGDSLRDLA